MLAEWKYIFKNTQERGSWEEAAGSQAFNSGLWGRFYKLPGKFPPQRSGSTFFLFVPLSLVRLAATQHRASPLLGWVLSCHLRSIREEIIAILINSLYFSILWLLVRLCFFLPGNSYRTESRSCLKLIDLPVLVESLAHWGDDADTLREKGDGGGRALKDKERERSMLRDQKVRKQLCENRIHQSLG